MSSGYLRLIDGRDRGYVIASRRGVLSRKFHKRLRRLDRLRVARILVKHDQLELSAAVGVCRIGDFRFRDGAQNVFLAPRINRRVVIDIGVNKIYNNIVKDKVTAFRFRGGVIVIYRRVKSG